MDKQELAKVEDEIRQRGMELAREKPQSLANTDFETWCKIASALTMGASPTSLKKKYNKHWSVVKNVMLDLFGTAEAFKEYQARGIEVNLMLVDDIKTKKLESMMDEGGTLDDARYVESLSKSALLDSQRHNRLKGEADVKHEHKTVTDEDLAALREKLLADMPEAEVIDD